MWIILGAVAIAVFLFGLVQWAYSGAGLWSVWSLKKDLRSASRDELAEKEGKIRRTEKRADQLMMTSLKVIGVLAVVMWLFLGLTVVLDLMGINWISTLSSRARTFWASSDAYTSAPAATRPPLRNSVLRFLGGALRK